MLTYGGIVQSIEVPDRDGNRANVVLGFSGLPGYLADNPYFGAIVGRYGNRIARARFSLDGETYHLAANNGSHHLHGGVVGFDRRVWRGEPVRVDDTVGVRLSYVSDDGEEGFPGQLTTKVTYTVTGTALRIDYRATTDRPTVVNLTNHSYFNLAGEGSGNVYGHRLRIDAGRYLPTDSTQIPIGERAPVAGTPFDFTRPRTLGERIRSGHPQLILAKGYDHCFGAHHRARRPALHRQPPRRAADRRQRPYVPAGRRIVP